jgi:hypothetical protein
MMATKNWGATIARLWIPRIVPPAILRSGVVETGEGEVGEEGEEGVERRGVRSTGRIRGREPWQREARKGCER